MHQSHLRLEKVVVQPTVEWEVPFVGWAFFGIVEGQGYWFSRSLVEELNPGDLLVTRPAQEGLLRASRIGEMHLDVFRFCPELMGGLLTLTERESLEHFGRNAGREIWLYPANCPVALQFAAVRELSDGGNGLRIRSHLLQIAMTFFDSEVKHPKKEESATVSARDRFEAVMNELTETEVGELSAAELADRCGCSLRHFGRLFVRRFGVSFRSRQMRIRMAKVRQMLLETDMKVRDVARANGYYHLGLFNFYFRKEFGMTPMECRRIGSENGSAKTLVRCC